MYRGAFSNARSNMAGYTAAWTREESEEEQAALPAATTALIELLEARQKQNEQLKELLPAFLEAMADELAEMEPRLANPAKRAKWAAKVTAKMLHRLPDVPALPEDQQEMDSLTELEEINRRQLATAIHRIEQQADVRRVMYALEGCRGSGWRAECAAQGIAVPDKEPTDLLYKVNTNLKQWYSQVTSEDRWRYAYFRSDVRTQAYAEAIKHCATGKRVVDVGVGSGLLPMLAARVALEVITIETSKTAYAAVEKTVAANGLSEKITVARSVKEALELATRDTTEVVLTCEVLSAVPITSELKTAIEIKAELAEQCHYMIPQRAQVFAAPANIPPQRVLLECPLLHQISGFDLSIFNCFRLHKPMPHQLNHLDHCLLSSPQQILELDLTSELDPGMGVLSAAPAEHSWNAVVSWYTMWLDDQICVETGPNHPDALQAIQYLPGPFPEPGNPIQFKMAHNGTTFGFSFDQPALPCELKGSELLRWHWGMVNDEYRNGLYDRAIQAAVAKKKKAKQEVLVLDIGTGSGLLSMMCSRAGADEIIAAEMVEPLATVAPKIAAHNGYTNISVHNKMSTALEVGTELPRKADILVSEIVDVALLGECMVPAVADASERLLAQDAVMIPSAATLIGCLLHIPPQPGVPGEAEGCHNLKLETEITVPGSEMYQQLLLNRLEHTRLSETFDVFNFNFYECAKHQEGENLTLEVVATSSGTLDAVGLWFSLDLDDETSLSTAPGSISGGDTCWQQALMWLQGTEEERTFEAGEVVKLKASHDGVHIRLALAN